ncbi:MAG: MarR family transcriptional regulator [Dehalococcoidales bacterium]|nr:MarR family transcriptional regulator [Dehalococcoidales bacterium]
MIPSLSEIEKVNAQIRSTQFSRLVAFADVVTRYTELVFKIKGDQISWLRASALRFIITRGGSLTLSQMAAVMLRSNYSITKLVDGLENDGLVKRCRNIADGRSFDVKVTQKGLNYVIESLKNSETAENELKSCLSESELNDLAIIMRKLRDKLIEKVSARYRLTLEDRQAIFGKVNYRKPNQELS